MVTVSNSTPNGILTMESVKDSFLNEEAERKIYTLVLMYISIAM